MNPESPATEPVAEPDPPKTIALHCRVCRRPFYSGDLQKLFTHLQQKHGDEFLMTVGLVLGPFTGLSLFRPTLPEDNDRYEEILKALLAKYRLDLEELIKQTIKQMEASAARGMGYNKEKK